MKRSAGRAVLVDASALVALLDRSDHLHEPCVAALADIHDPLVTVWPALTEAMHLLGGYPRAQQALIAMIEDDALELAELSILDLGRLGELMQRYTDLPTDFADAALVCVAERDGLHRILTFDAHFQVYALPQRTRFVILPAMANAAPARRRRSAPRERRKSAPDDAMTR